MTASERCTPARRCCSRAEAPDYSAKAGGDPEHEAHTEKHGDPQPGRPDPRQSEQPEEQPEGARRVGAIVLGLLAAIATGALWLLFWLFGLAWVWPPGLGIAVFLGMCFVLGIAALPSV